MTQPELDFERLEGKGPEVEKFQVDEMIDALRGRGWRTAADLGARKEKTNVSSARIAEGVGRNRRQPADIVAITCARDQFAQNLETVRKSPRGRAALQWFQKQSVSRRRKQPF